jgi:hypothetical protein
MNLSFEYNLYETSVFTEQKHVRNTKVWSKLHVCLFGDARAEKFGKLRKKMLDCKELKKEKQEWGCQEMLPNPPKDWAMHEGDDPSFWNEVN